MSVKAPKEITEEDRKAFHLLLPACFGPEEEYGTKPTGFSRIDRTVGPVRLFECLQHHKFIRWGRIWMLAVPDIQEDNPCKGCPLRIDV